MSICKYPDPVKPECQIQIGCWIIFPALQVPTGHIHIFSPKLLRWIYTLWHPIFLPSIAVFSSIYHFFNVTNRPRNMWKRKLFLKNCYRSSKEIDEFKKLPILASHKLLVLALVMRHLFTAIRSLVSSFRECAEIIFLSEVLTCSPGIRSVFMYMCSQTWITSIMQFYRYIVLSRLLVKLVNTHCWELSLHCSIAVKISEFHL